jgi:hypothetical protein
MLVLIVGLRQAKLLLPDQEATSTERFESKNQPAEKSAGFLLKKNS